MFLAAEPAQCSLCCWAATSWVLASGHTSMQRHITCVKDRTLGFAHSLQPGLQLPRMLAVLLHGSP
jgi:hypothetical protein